VRKRCSCSVKHYGIKRINVGYIVPAKRRLRWLCMSLACAVAGVSIGLHQCRDHVVFFMTPSELLTTMPTPTQQIRLGGLVLAGSVVKVPASTEIRCRISDGEQEVALVYHGLLPPLFAENQGVIALGSWGEDGIFHAKELLAKHDEYYMPPEVATSLKKQGRWREPGDSIPKERP